MRILEEIPIMDFNVRLALTILVICVVLGCVLGIVIGYISNDFSACPFCFLVGLVLGLCIGGMVGDIFEKESGKYQYRVEIDNTILLSDFIQEYEIVDIESSNILIIKERIFENEDEETTNKKNTEVNLK